MIAGRLRAAGKVWTRAAGKVWTSGRQSDKMDLVPESGRQKILKKVQKGVDKSGRQGYDGTISQSGREQEMTTIAAPQNTKCNPAGFTCATDKDAVHMVDGRPLCAYHSPYDVVEANGKTSMENYLARFDARHAATETVEQEAEEAASSPALTTKVAEDIEQGDVILTQYGWVVVTFWEHHFARAIDPRTQWNEREITRVYVNRRYGFEAGTQVTVHANPKGFTHERFQASRRLLDGFKTWA